MSLSQLLNTVSDIPGTLGNTNDILRNVLVRGRETVLFIFPYILPDIYIYMIMKGKF